MSKQSDAKKRQGYSPKAAQRVCMTCCYFQSDLEEQTNGYMMEKNLRCGLGGFAVKKMGLCNEWVIRGTA